MPDSRFSTAELNKYDSFLPPIEVYMGRLRCSGMSQEKIAKSCGCRQHSVHHRLKKLRQRLDCLAKLQYITLEEFDFQLECVFQNPRDFRMIRESFRGKSQSEIGRSMGMLQVNVRHRILSIFDELEGAKLKYLHGTHPQRLWSDILRSYWDQKKTLTWPVELATYKVTPPKAK